jgi:hypothetical protein
MTEPIEQPEPGQLEPADDDDAVLDMAAMRRVRREAAALRKRVHELESDNERLITQQAAAERREIEREASSVLADPADIWRTDEATQQAFVDAEFREIVPDAVRDAARLLTESKPHLARRATPPPTNQPVESLRPGASPQQESKPAATWFGAIRGS